MRILRDPNGPFNASDLAGGQQTHTPPPQAPVNDPRVDDLLQRVTQLADHNKKLEQQNVYLHSQITELRQPTQPAQVQSSVDPRTEFFENPQAAVGREIETRLAPLIETFNTTTAEAVKERIVAKYRKEFEKWGGEIEARMAQLHPSYRTNYGVWEMSVKLVMADHLTDYIKDPELTVAFSEPAGGHRMAVPGPDTRPAAEQLTEKEKKIAFQWGLTPEKYLERKKKMVVDVPED